MPDAIQTLITELQEFVVSKNPQPVKATMANMIAAFQEIEAGLSPIITVENANTIYAGPISGPAALPTFRALVSADIPGGSGAANAQLILAPGSAAAPSLVSSTDETGIYFTAGVLNFSGSGVRQFAMNAAGALFAANAAGPEILNVAASATVPTIVPNRAAGSTGWGAQAAGNMSGIVAGVEITRITAAGVAVAATLAHFWLGRSQILSPSDGTLVLENNAGTGFTELMFGGTTAAFPALAVNGTALEAQLADGSAQAALQAASIQFGAGEILSQVSTGTWTPIDASGAGLVFAAKSGFYRRIGDTVFVWAFITYPVTADASQAQIGGLPFTIVNLGTTGYPGNWKTTASVDPYGMFNLGGTTMAAINSINNGFLFNSNFSGANVFLSGTFAAA